MDARRTAFAPLFLIAVSQDATRDTRHAAPSAPLLSIVDNNTSKHGVSGYKPVAQMDIEKIHIDGLNQLYS